jgi:hypothetical protein
VTLGTRHGTDIQQRPANVSPSRSTAITTEAPEPIAPAKPVRANRIVAGIVLTVMVVMAGAGLILALNTVKVRREHDTALPPRLRRPFDIFRKKETRPAELGEAVAPSRLAGLGYLPRGTNVVAAVHVEELLASPAGKELRRQGVKIGNREWKLDAIKDSIGLPIEEIDHVVLGVQMREEKDVELTPPLYLVVRTRQAYDADRVKKTLQATKPRSEAVPGGGKRTIYSAKVQNLPLPLQNLPLLLWLADERTFVLNLFSKKMEDVPVQPDEDASQFPAELRQVIQQRLDAGTPIWLAGHSNNWELTLLPKLLDLFGSKRVPVLSRWKDVRTFAIALHTAKPLKLIGAFRSADEPAAKRIEREELVPRQKADPDGFKYIREGEWLTVQVKIDIGGGNSTSK